MDDREQSVQHFLDLIKRSHRGKFKIYIGMIALSLIHISEPTRRS